MLCHQILVKICRYSPGAVLGSLDSLLDPLEKDANKKVKDQQVRTPVISGVLSLLWVATTCDRESVGVPALPPVG